MAKKKRIGKLPPRYSFILNSYTDVRLSKCPRCQKLTHLRKFALFIHIDAWGPMALGKTCRYCSRCELIMAHQDELEAQLAHSFSQMAPEVIGNEYGCRSHIDVGTLRHAAPGCPVICVSRLTGHRHSGIRVFSHAPPTPAGSPHASIAEPCLLVQ